MRTLLPDPPPAPFDQLLAERERRGADRRDEVWEGAHDVSELVIVDPEAHTVQWLALSRQGGYAPTERSAVIDLSADRLAERIDWPT